MTLLRAAKSTDEMEIQAQPLSPPEAWQRFHIEDGLRIEQRVADSSQ